MTREHGGWAVHIQSVPIQSLDPPIAAALTQAVGDAHLSRREITVHDACVLLSQQAQGGGTAVKAVAHIDPHLPYVPRWLVEFVLMVMLPMVYGKLSSELQRVFADPLSEHNLRNQGGAVYGLIRQVSTAET